jgi:alkaline phosphatase
VFSSDLGTVNDTSGGILVRAAGRHSEKVSGSFDNTKIYELMRSALFDGGD